MLPLVTAWLAAELVRSQKLAARYAPIEPREVVAIWGRYPKTVDEQELDGFAHIHVPEVQGPDGDDQLILAACLQKFLICTLKRGAHVGIATAARAPHVIVTTARDAGASRAAHVVVIARVSKLPWLPLLRRQQLQPLKQPQGRR